MFSLPQPVRPVPSVSPVLASILSVRVSFLTPQAGTRKDTFVRIERRSDEDDAAVFLKAIGEYRYRHGLTCRIAAIDLHPGQ